jgi:hypothetical protein
MSTSSPAGPLSHPKPWEQTNPWIAGILAYLVPGAGHFYQGRTLKGVIYSVSILGLFWWGQKLGEGMVVYNIPDKGAVFPLNHVSLSYAAQLGVGASALPPFIQNRRAEHQSNMRSSRLRSSLSASFQGTLASAGDADGGQLVGNIKLDPVDGQFDTEVKGTFNGTLNGQPKTLNLGGRFEIDNPIKSGFRRNLRCGIVAEGEDARMTSDSISGTIPRSFVDAYGSPPDADQLQDLNGRLGKLYELALVFTWIAGLLNVLAIWDCVYGPAYGFGDEHAAVTTAEKSTLPSDGTSSATGNGTAPDGSRPAPTRSDNRPSPTPTV